ncbi:GLPGLI family protein [uncultured Tenacibaculum sp.]|uniref:GLPGLI family protein n=1 Tax=Tenacibaculum sp. A30 TaxID=3442644 RepID=UPI00261978ED|nr:GLPGLI family protein [uncultured Tenacibaculum sp.]
MKNILTILFFVSLTFSYSQNSKSIIISYDEYHKVEDKKDNLFTKATLLHNIKEYAYVVDPKKIGKEEVNEGATEVVRLKEVPYQVYFKDLKKNTAIRQIGEKNSISLISDINQIIWDMKNESVFIEGLNCKKAIAKSDKGIITAWYTEELGVSGGPREYGGLPGLILYLENDYFIYKVTKIEKSKSKSILPKKDKTTTFQTLNELKKGVVKTKKTTGKTH